MPLTPDQLKIIHKLNNLPRNPDCNDCAGQTCWLATQAAGDALQGIFSMPDGYTGCGNVQIVSMTLIALREMSQG